MSQLQGVPTSITKKIEIDEDVDLKAIARSILSQKFLILGLAAVTTLLALAISFALPKTYVSQATILPTSDSDARSALVSGLASQLGAAGLLGGLGTMGGGRSADLVEILDSRSMAERVIEKNHLDRALTGWKTQGDLLKKVMKMTTVTPPSLKDKVISVEVAAPKPDLAALMANSYISELKGMLDEIGYNSASKNRKFVEQQLINCKNELAAAEDKLAQFQAKSHLASLPETVVASIRSVSDLEAQRTEAQVQLKSTDEALGAIRSRVSALQADPNSLVDLEVKRKGLMAKEMALDQAKQDFLNKLTNLPPQAMELARLQRDVQVQNAVYLALNQEYETAVIYENKDSDAFLPLDKAAVPDRPTKPKKLLITFFGLLAGLLCGSIIAVLKSRKEELMDGKRI